MNIQQLLVDMMTPERLLGRNSDFLTGCTECGPILSVGSEMKLFNLVDSPYIKDAKRYQLAYVMERYALVTDPNHKHMILAMKEPKVNFICHVHRHST